MKGEYTTTTSHFVDVDESAREAMKKGRAMDGLTEGRIVHYVAENGEHRAAMVVRVWNKETGYINLQVFLDGANDVAISAQNPYWATSVPYAETPSPRTWHWIEKA